MDKKTLKTKQFLISNEEIKQMYLNGYSLNDIAKKAQTTKGLMALRSRLHSLGVDTTKDMKKYSFKMSEAKKKYSLNRKYFETIDTEDKAYFLGLLYADGYNHESKTMVSLRLKAEDVEILEIYKQCIETNAPIHTFNRVTVKNKLHRQYKGLEISSAEFSYHLANQGCMQNKTFKLKFPNLPEHLIHHFIRGYFDGDGCISITPRKDRTPDSKIYQSFILGRECFMQEINKYFYSKVGKVFPIYKTKNVYRLNCSGRNNIKKFLDTLYQDATIYLKRKYDLYKML